MSLCKAQKDNTPVYHDSKSSVLLTFIQLKECFSNAIVIRGMNTKLEFSCNYTKLAMLSFLYCFVVKRKIYVAKSLPPLGFEPATPTP